MSSGTPPGPPPAPSADGGSGAASIVATAVVMLVISGAAVAARFYARGRLKNVLGREDWSLLTAWLLSLGYTIAVIFQCHAGLGSHIWTISPAAFVLYMKAQWVVGLLYQLSLAAAKISILLLYIRVLKHQYACWAAWGMLVVVVGYNIFGLVEDFIICAPLAAYWDPSVGSCQPPGSVMWALICLHIATDFLIFLIPLPVVFRMKLPLKQKIGLSLTFALGFFVCFISILRVIFISQLYASNDFTWDSSAISDWTSVEINTAIIVPCLIVLKPLVKKLFPRFFTADHSRIGPFVNARSPVLSPSQAAVPVFGHEEVSRESEKDFEHLPMTDLESQLGRDEGRPAQPAKT